MANETELKKLVDLDRLARFNEKVSAREDDKDAAILAEAKEYTDTEIGKVSTAAGTLTDRVTAVENKASANETAIGVLNGDEATAGSVKKIVADKVAEIVAGAPEDLDTLKEISDWISGHANDASAMNSAIQKNATDITNLTSRMDAREEFVDSEIDALLAADQDFLGRINEAESDIIVLEDTVAGHWEEILDAQSNITKINTKITALETALNSIATDDDIDALFA